MSASFILVDAGVAEYEEVYATQRSLIDKKKQGISTDDYLIFVEHPDVYTYGRKNKEGSQEPALKSFFVERGGDVTFHNVGQLVCYPLLSLAVGERDLHLHLRRLELTIIDTLAHFNIEGERREGATGVWVAGKEKKIASIGVAVTGWVTYHGSALNVTNDLSGFSKIHPCGFSSEVMTSMKSELGEKCPGIKEVKEVFLLKFCERFERKLKIVERADDFTPIGRIPIENGLPAT